MHFAKREPAKVYVDEVSVTEIDVVHLDRWRMVGKCTPVEENIFDATGEPTMRQLALVEVRFLQSCMRKVAVAENSAVGCRVSQIRFGETDALLVDPSAFGIGAEDAASIAASNERAIFDCAVPQNPSGTTSSVKSTIDDLTAAQSPAVQLRSCEVENRQ